MIVFDNVDFSYHNTKGEAIPALDGIELAVSEGEFLLILGSNGSGKTTLLKLACGLLLPGRGTVRIRGLDTGDPHNRSKILNIISLVLSRPSDMIFSPVVEEDVAFGLECRGLPGEKIRTRVERSLTMVGMMEFRKAQTHQLSGGEQQKVVLAGSLAQNPDILLLDEPTAYLDSGESRRMLKLVQKLRRRNSMTLLLATHRPDPAFQADRVLVLQEGKAVFTGPPTDLSNRPGILRAAGLIPSKTALLRKRLRKKGIPVGNPSHTPELLVRRLCELGSRTSPISAGKDP